MRTVHRTVTWTVIDYTVTVTLTIYKYIYIIICIFVSVDNVNNSVDKAGKFHKIFSVNLLTTEEVVLSYEYAIKPLN